MLTFITIKLSFKVLNFLCIGGFHCKYLLTLFLCYIVKNEERNYDYDPVCKYIVDFNEESLVLYIFDLWCFSYGLSNYQ